jgi:hypothetical protein
MAVTLVVTTEFFEGQLGSQECFLSTVLVALSPLRVLSITSLSIKLFFSAFLFCKVLADAGNVREHTLTVSFSDRERTLAAL